MTTRGAGKAIVRCSWAESDPQMQAYHDEEWGVPMYDSRALWELLMLEGFQAGLAWIVVLKKREALREVFRQFDPAKVARLGETDVARMLDDARIIRSRAKIEATIQGARIFREMQKSGQSFASFAWELAGGKPVQNHGPVLAQSAVSVEIAKALKAKGFKFVGPTIVYAWMQAAGMINDHAPTCFRRAICAKMKGQPK